MTSLFARHEIVFLIGAGMSHELPYCTASQELVYPLGSDLARQIGIHFSSDLLGSNSTINMESPSLDEVVCKIVEATAERERANKELEIKQYVKRFFDEINKRRIDSNVRTPYDLLAEILNTTGFKGAEIVTTNYDTELEDSLTRKRLDYKTYISVRESYVDPVGDNVIRVYKLHGDVRRANTILLRKSELDRSKDAFYTDIQSSFQNKVLLVLGHSFRDPNLASIYEKVEHSISKKAPTYLCALNSEQISLGEEKQVVVLRAEHTPVSNVLGEVAKILTGKSPEEILDVDLGVPLDTDERLRKTLESIPPGSVLVLRGHDYSGKTLMLKRVLRDRDDATHVSLKEIQLIEGPASAKLALNEAQPGKVKVVEATPSTYNYALNYDSSKSDASVTEFVKQVGNSMKRWTQKISAVDQTRKCALLEHELSESDSKRLYWHFLERSGSAVTNGTDETDRFHVLVALSSIGKKQLLIVPLLRDKLLEYKNKSIDQIRTRVAIEDEALAGLSAFLGADLVVTPLFEKASEHAPEMLDGVVGATGAASGFLTPLAAFPPVGFLLLGASALITFWKMKREVAFGKYLQAFADWNELSVYKRQLLCDKLDYKYFQPSGTAYSFFSAWFNERNVRRDNLEALFPTNRYAEVTRTLESLTQRYSQLSIHLDELSDMLDQHEKRIRALEDWMEKTERWKIDLDARTLTNAQKSSVPCLYVSNRTLSSDELERRLLECIQVQLQTQNGKAIPFCDFDAAEETIRDTSRSLLIVGQSGSGKTRLIYEAIKRRLMTVDGLWILGVNIPGAEIVELDEILQRVEKASANSNQILLWDNFPRGLSPNAEDSNKVKDTLQQLSTKTSDRVHCLVALKPDWFGRAEDTFGELRTGNFEVFTIQYGLRDLKSLLLSMSDVYFDANRKRALESSIEAVSSSLFENWNTPQAVQQFLETIRAQDHLSAAQLTESARWLSKDSYLKWVRKTILQLGSLERSFLYLVMIGAIFGLDNRLASIDDLQISLTGTKADVRKVLSQWVYYKEGHLFVHDSLRYSLVFPDIRDLAFAYIRRIGFKEFLDSLATRSVRVEMITCMRFLAFNRELYSTDEFQLVIHIGRSESSSTVSTNRELSPRAYDGREQSLRVADARQRDVGHGKVRVGDFTLLKLGITSGDFLEIHGKRVTVTVAWPAYAEDKGQDIIRMDGLTRRNAGVALNEFVSARKADVNDAQAIVFAPTDVRLSVDEEFLSFVKRRFMDMPFIEGDMALLDIFGSAVPLEVVKTRPQGTVKVTEATYVEALSEPAPGKIGSRPALLELGKRWDEAVGSAFSYVFLSLTESDKQLLLDYGSQTSQAALFTSEFLDEINRDFMQFSPKIRTHLIYIASRVHDIYIGEKLGVTVGNAYPILPDTEKDQVLRLVQEITKNHQSIYFVRHLAIGIAQRFAQLSNEYMTRILEWISSADDPTSYFAEAVCSCLPTIPPSQQEPLWKLAKTNEIFGKQFGKGIVGVLEELSSQQETRLKELASCDTAFAEGLGIEISSRYDALKPETKEVVVELTRVSKKFARTFASEIGGWRFKYRSATDQERLLQLVRESEDFAEEFAEHAFSFERPSSPLHDDELIELTRRSEGFARGFGSAMGNNLCELPFDDRERSFQLLRDNGAFAEGFGSGFAKCDYEHVSKYLPLVHRVRILELLSSNSSFLVGFHSDHLTESHIGSHSKRWLTQHLVKEEKQFPDLGSGASSESEMDALNKRCALCGGRLRTDAKFCTHCGSKTD